MPNLEVSTELDSDLRLYKTGVELRPLVNSRNWETVLEVIQQYVDDIDQQVRSIPPGDPTVVAAHASLYALNDFAVKFKQDIERAVDFANQPNDEVRNYLFGVRDALDVARATGQGV
jgi:hypothetical protein